jgi:hypothetical protein
LISISTFLFQIKWNENESLSYYSRRNKYGVCFYVMMCDYFKKCFLTIHSENRIFGNDQFANGKFRHKRFNNLQILNEILILENTLNSILWIQFRRGVLIHESPQSMKKPKIYVKIEIIENFRHRCTFKNSLHLDKIQPKKIIKETSLS